MLLTYNRASMPLHLAAHVAAGGKIPGIFILKRGWGFAQTADHLVLVAGASLEGEHENQIRYLPLA